MHGHRNIKLVSQYLRIPIIMNVSEQRVLLPSRPRSFEVGNGHIYGAKLAMVTV